MDWSDVKKVLLSEVVSLMKDPTRGEEWLLALERTPDGQRLGICIAIDVLSGALDPKVFSEIIELIDPRAPDQREAFGRIVNEPPACEDLICKSKFYPDSKDKEAVYARVLELGDFIQFYVDRGYTRARTHVKRIRTMYFSPADGVELSGVRVWWRGRMPNVWVAPFDELHNLIKGLKEDERGRAVYDAFGLIIKGGVGGKNRPELVGVKYPEGFGVGCSQPTTLDAWWIDVGAYYLSYGKDDKWGRTQSLTGASASQRERVHSYFKHLTAGYQTYYIGVATRPTEQPDKLLEEGYLRFEQVLKAKGAAGP